MIIHRYPDGSEGYEYQINDKVIVLRATHDFNQHISKLEYCTVKFIAKDERNLSWNIRHIEVQHSSVWGLALVATFNCRPHPDSMKSATIVYEKN